MTKKEFVLRMDSILNSGSIHFSCFTVRRYFGERAMGLYKEFIAEYLIPGTPVLRRDYPESSRQYDRLMMLSSFKEECLKTKIYKEF